ncbi:MAG: T9SS type A sorting domain-containing protein [Agriterribacter sp.]
MKKVYALLFTLSLLVAGYATTITSKVITGNWNAATTWVGGVVPTATDDVIIANGAIITINATAACTNLTVGQGVSGSLLYNTGATGRSLTITGNIVINTGAVFSAGASGAAVNSLLLAGNLTNSGTFTDYISTNIINITFNGTANSQVFSNTGTITNNELKSITVNNTFTGGTVTIPSGLAMTSGTTLTLTAGSFYAGTGGTGSITLGSATAGTFTCVRTLGELVAASSSFGTGVTTKTYTYNGAATQTTGAELTTASSVTIDALTINNVLLRLTLNKHVNVNTLLTFTNGIVYTTGSTMLSLGTASAAGILSGGTATAYIEGPFARTFGVRASSATYNATTLFPVGKNGIYFPVYMAPTTTVAGVKLKAEAFDTNAGTNLSASGTVSQHRWETSAITNVSGLANLFIRQYDSLVSATNKIIRATSAGGVYSSVAPATVYATALLSTGTAVSATEFNANGYLSFGDACNPLPDIAGPLNICTGAVSQLFPTAGIYMPAAGTWSTDAAGIATVDASGNVTGVSTGSATITFTISAPDGCDGLQATRIVNISNCSFTPGGISSNLVSWYRADAGLTASTWTDQTGTNDLTASGAPSTNASMLNFNTVATFDGSVDYFSNPTAEGWLGNANASTYYYVATCTNVSNRVVYGKGVTNTSTTSIHGGSTPGGLMYANGLVYGPPYTSTWAGVPTMLSRSGFNGGAAAPFYVSSNGTTEIASGSVTPVLVPNSPFFIGRAVVSGAFWKGDIAEVIVYNGKHSSSDYNRVQSYLALKYGISLDQTIATSYLASDGSKMWDATTAGSFNKNIFGIGKDVLSGLDQRISRSINTSTLLTISTDADFTSNNTVHADILGNKNFLTVADNGAGLTWSNSNKPGYAILRKAWKFNNAAPVTLHLQFDVDNAGYNVPADIYGSGYYLVTDPNADGNYSDGVVITLTNTSGSLWSGIVTPTTGMAFSLAIVVPPIEGKPGGVSGSAIWLKANTGVPSADGQAVSTWMDMSGVRINNATYENELSAPVYAASGNGLINYNPSVLFNGLGDGLNFGNDFITSINATGGVHSFGSVKPTIPATTKTIPLILDAGGVAGDGYGFGYSNTNGFAYTPSNKNGVTVAFSNPASSTDPVLLDFDVNYLNFGSNEFYSLNGLAKASSAITLYSLEPGNTLYTVSSIHGAVGGPFTIGRSAKTDNWTGDGIRAFGGYVGEVVHFNRNLSATEIKQVRSYLALKYGTTLDNSVTDQGDYLLSNAALAWDGETNPGYQKGVIGIVRDDSSAFRQKQSHTIDDSLRVFIGNLTTANTDNTTTINNNLSSLIIGNDGGGPQWSPSVSKPAIISSRLVRTFKVTNTNFSNSFSVEIKCDAIASIYDITSLRLLVSTSSDFSGAAIYGDPDVTFAFGSIIVKGINNSIIPANTTRYITVGLTLVILPVELTAFNAIVMNNESVKLDWQTVSEKNNSYFVVQKSADAQSWINVKSVKGYGNASATNYYSAVDENPYGSTSYYRLQQTSSDGKQVFSAIKKVYIEESSLISIYPNPTAGDVTIKGPASALSHIRVFNMTGQDITSAVRPLEWGKTKVVIDFSAVSKGVYMLMVGNTTKKIIRK